MAGENLAQSRLDRPVPALPSKDVTNFVQSAVAAARKHVNEAAREIEEAQKRVIAARAEVVAQQGSLQTSKSRGRKA